jgi:methyl-galactoside transport system substrate-binding protein
MRNPALAWILAAIALTACTGGANGARPKIGLAVSSMSDTVVARAAASFQKHALGKADVAFRDARGLQTSQDADIAALLAGHAQVLVVSLADRSDAAAIVDTAKGKRIPLIFLASQPSSDDLVKWDKVYYVGAKPAQAEAFQGEMAVAWWRKHPEADRNRDGRMQYILLTGRTKDGEASASTASLAAITQAGLPVVELARGNAAGSQEKARAFVADCLSRFGAKIEFILCEDDVMALGAIQALKAAGYFKAGKSMPVMGLGASAQAIAAVAEGSLAGTVLDDAESQGKAAFELAWALARTGKAEGLAWTIDANKYLWVPCTKITKENVAQFSRMK